MKKTGLSILLIGLIILTSCGNPANNSNDIPQGFAKIKGKIKLPNNLPIPAEGIEVFTVGQEQYKAISDKDGNYEILIDTRKESLIGKTLQQAKAGIGDLGSLGYQLVALTQDSEYGTKIDNVSTTEGSESLLPPITIEKTGKISGVVTLEGGADPSGTDVYIPGTSFMAKADNNGTFAISKVPTGNYLYLRAEKQGYSPKFWTDVKVAADSETNVQSLVLPISKGVEASVSIENGALYSRNKRVNINLQYSSDAFLMQVSEDPTFIGAKWVIVKDSFEYTFNSDGLKTIYINLADSNGLETKISDSIIIISDFAPANLQPNESTGDLKPDFRWDSPVVINQTFDFQLSSEPLFKTNIEEHLGLSINSIKINSVLENKKNYYWRVRSYDNENGYSRWIVEDFKINISVPTPISPQYEEILSNSKPTLTWTTNTTVSSYRIEISDRADFSNILESASGITDTKYIPKSILNSSTTYYWRVAAESDDNKIGDWGGPSQFYLDIPAIILDSPGNDKLFSTRTPLFTWQTTPQARNYTIQISEKSDFSILVLETSGIAINSFKPEEPGLKGEKEYYWRVAYRDKNGSLSNWSVPRVFRIEAYSLSNVSPTEIAPSSKPLFSWGKSYLAYETYEFQLAIDFDFKNIIEKADNIASQSYKLNGVLVNKETCYWRVRAVAEDGDKGPWTTPQKIVLDLGNTVLYEPWNDQTIYNAFPTFKWQPQSWAGSYRIQIASDREFSRIVSDSISSMSEYQIKSILPDNCELFWRVAPRDINIAQGEWSNINRFVLPPHTLSLTISYNLPEGSKTAQLYGGGAYSITNGNTLELRVENFWDFNTFEWAVDGVPVKDADGKKITTSSCSIPFISKGRYSISLIAMRNGIPYDTQATVIVQ